LSVRHLFGARLRQYRVERGLSQQALGRLVHVSGDLIGKIEKGERAASSDLARRCDAELAAEGRLIELRAVMDKTVSGSAGAVEREAVVSHLPALRRVLDAHDLPEDGPLPDLDTVRRGVARIVSMRLASQYQGLATELPTILPAYLRAFHASTGQQRAELARLLTQALRAADAIADKFALYDLSARIIGILTSFAEASGDEPTMAAAAYVRAEVFFANGDYLTGRRMLERAATALSSIEAPPMAAVYGALHMRAAVLAARAGQRDSAYDHIAEAAEAAARTSDGIYTGTAFGPSSVRIHQVSLAIDAGAPADALRVAKEWVPPLDVPAERRSHFFVDVADAQTQCGHSDEALATLQVARRIAPQHIRHHPQVKTMLLTLTQETPRVSPALRELTKWTGALSL
jgi:DNA-binding XRE family transcriptional regulator